MKSAGNSIKRLHFLEGAFVSLSISSHGRDRYGYAVCGLGPAGCGFLLHAIKENAIESLVEKGLVLIDRAVAPGAGNVGRYHLTGNSLSRAFLDCVDDPKLAWLFRDLLATEPSIAKLRELEFLAPPLHLVGDMLAAIATRTLSHLAEVYEVPVLTRTSVDRIRREADGSFSLKLRNLIDNDQYNLRVDNALCSFGGRQATDVILRCDVQPGLKLGDHANHLVSSDDLLMMSNEAIREAIPVGPGAMSDVVIIGGSHSAMSVIDRLTDSLGPVGLKRIVMLHRDALRLYYPAIGDARRDGYDFDDPGDICPMSGRVNRFGGLRYRSFDVARSIIETGRTPDQSVEVVSLPLRESPAETIRKHLAQSAATVACLGYQANLPKVVDRWNQRIELQNQARGLEIDEAGRALTVDDQPVPGLFVFGIGSRLLKRSDAIGGEPSFKGSADGVWLYHNHGGGVILDALRCTWSKDPRESTLKARRTDHARVVQ